MWPSGTRRRICAGDAGSVLSMIFLPGKGKRRAPGAWPHYDTGQEPTDFNYPGVSADPGDVVCKLWIRHKLRPRDPFVKCSPDLATLATQASLLLIHCYDRLERLALSIHSFDRLRHGWF